MFEVRRIGGHEGELLRDLRLAALADAPGDATTTLQRARSHDLRHWQESAAANSSGPLQATFVVDGRARRPERREATDPVAVPAGSGPSGGGRVGAGDGSPASIGGVSSGVTSHGPASDLGDWSASMAGMVGAYANRDGTVNVVGLWSAPGHRDVGVADALLDAVAIWARGEAGARRLRIWVVERNEHARRYYEAQGFHSTGSEIPYQPDPRIFQLEMVRDL